MSDVEGRVSGVEGSVEVVHVGRQSVLVFRVLEGSHRTVTVTVDPLLLQPLFGLLSGPLHPGLTFGSRTTVVGAGLGG